MVKPILLCKIRNTLFRSRKRLQPLQLTIVHSCLSPRIDFQFERCKDLYSVLILFHNVWKCNCRNCFISSDSYINEMQRCAMISSSSVGFRNKGGKYIQKMEKDRYKTAYRKMLRAALSKYTCRQRISKHALRMRSTEQTRFTDANCSI